MPVSSSKIIKTLKANGWYLERVKGSHHQFKNSDNPNLVTIPHPRKDMAIGTLKKIEKDSGLKF